MIFFFNIPKSSWPIDLLGFFEDAPFFTCHFLIYGISIFVNTIIIIIIIIPISGQDCLCHKMTKGSKLSEFEESEITALKRVVKSQREISKALGHSKTIICNYLSMEQESQLAGQKFLLVI